MCLLKISADGRVGSVVCTCLDNIADRVEVDGRDEFVYARYRIEAFSGHEDDDCLGNMSSRMASKFDFTDLHKKKEGNVR